MLRETNLQPLHWADKTMSMLQRDQLEACEKRLATLPSRSIFEMDDDTYTEEVWAASYDAQEHPLQNELHTVQGLRARVLSNLSAEAALLSIDEHMLLERMLSLGGTAELIDWEEVSAAESLVKRMWCTISRKDGVIHVHLPKLLVTPLTLTIGTRQHQELRERLITLDTIVRAMLCIGGVLHYRTPLIHLLTDVLRDTYACDMSLALRCIRASFDYTYDRKGDLILLHPGLADPERLMTKHPPMNDAPLLMDEETMTIAVWGMLPQERPLAEALLCQIAGAVRPELTEQGAVEDLLILAKQGVPVETMQEVLGTLLMVQPTPEMRRAVAAMHANTPRWGVMRTDLVQ